MSEGKRRKEGERGGRERRKEERGEGIKLKGEHCTHTLHWSIEGREKVEVERDKILCKYLYCRNKSIGMVQSVTQLVRISYFC